MVSKIKKAIFCFSIFLAALCQMTFPGFQPHNIRGQHKLGDTGNYTGSSIGQRNEQMDSGKEISAEELRNKAVVFYNLFVNSTSDVDRVSLMVQEQLSLLNASVHEMVVNLYSIGVPIPALGNLVPGVDIRVLDHTKQGSELETLHLAWEYCRVHPDRKIVYLHSKGSFHPSTDNDKLRNFLTQGALSADCAQLPGTCNVCSSRMSPLPHPHTSGNMWLARCSYVNNLMEPYAFRDAMGEGENWCIGTGRFAAEHWVHSHPSVRPCDLSTDINFNWGYDNIPQGSFPSQLAPAPRFSYDAYVKFPSCKFPEFLQFRLSEYERIHGLRPDDSWWGWKFYQDEPLPEDE